MSRLRATLSGSIACAVASALDATWTPPRDDRGRVVGVFSTVSVRKASPDDPPPVFVVDTRKG